MQCNEQVLLPLDVAAKAKDMSKPFKSIEVNQGNDQVRLVILAPVHGVNDKTANRLLGNEFFKVVGRNPDNRSISEVNTTITEPAQLRNAVCAIIADTGHPIAAAVQLALRENWLFRQLHVRLGADVGRFGPQILKS